MRSINKVIIIGNVVRDAEMRQTPSGQNVTTFTVATNRDWMTRDGQRHSLTEFHDIVAWARLAEICGQYLNKGKLVYIEGYLKTRSWDTPEGQKKFRTEIVAQDVIMLEKRAQGSERMNNDSEEYYPSEEEENLGQPVDEEMPMEQNTPKTEMKAEDSAAAAKTPAEMPTGAISSAMIDNDLGL